MEGSTATVTPANSPVISMRRRPEVSTTLPPSKKAEDLGKEKEKASLSPSPLPASAPTPANSPLISTLNRVPKADSTRSAQPTRVEPDSLPPSSNAKSSSKLKPPISVPAHAPAPAPPPSSTSATNTTATTPRASAHGVLDEIAQRSQHHEDATIVEKAVGIVSSAGMYLGLWNSNGGTGASAS